MNAPTIYNIDSDTHRAMEAVRLAYYKAMIVDGLSINAEMAAADAMMAIERWAAIVSSEAVRARRDAYRTEAA